MFAVKQSINILSHAKLEQTSLLALHRLFRHALVVFAKCVILSNLNNSSFAGDDSTNPDLEYEIPEQATPNWYCQGSETDVFKRQERTKDNPTQQFSSHSR